MQTSEECPVCGGDCAGANPPVLNCPTELLEENKQLRRDLAKRGEIILTLQEVIVRHRRTLESIATGRKRILGYNIENAESAARNTLERGD